MVIHKISYLAGFFDGEGCVVISRYGKGKKGFPTLVLEASITNTDYVILAKFQDEFGGIISPRKRIENRKPLWAWKCCSQTAANFLKVIEPYSIGKKKEIHIAILFAKKFHKGRKGRKWRLTISDYNERVQYKRALERIKHEHKTVIV